MSAIVDARWVKAPDGTRLELVRRLRQPIDRVWAALTTPARLAAWMGVEWLGGDGPLKIGDAFDYRFANTDMESRGRVLSFDPPRMFEHSWFENIPPAAVVRWSLAPDGEGCILTLTQYAGPPEDGPRTAAGWTMLLDSINAPSRRIRTHLKRSFRWVWYWRGKASSKRRGQRWPPQRLSTLARRARLPKHGPGERWQ